MVGFRHGSYARSAFTRLTSYSTVPSSISLSTLWVKLSSSCTYTELVTVRVLPLLELSAIPYSHPSLPCQLTAHSVKQTVVSWARVPVCWPSSAHSSISSFPISAFTQTCFSVQFHELATNL